ncbi:DUF4268 domain-containing protein, partial [candidate division KSB1 bacterium]|nr:DUF4268 domain-containing protein [candidate division KSB1 bacterium]
QSKKIGGAKKEWAKSQRILHNFWVQYLENFGSELLRYKSGPPKSNYLGVSTGNAGIYLFMCVTKRGIRVEIYIDRADRDLNKKAFDELFLSKIDIEKEIGLKLLWLRLDNKNASKISYDNNQLNVYDEKNWDQINEFLSENSLKFKDIFFDRINQID